LWTYDGIGERNVGESSVGEKKVGGNNEERNRVEDKDEIGVKSDTD
jgi:hypothetical protein